VLCASYLLGSSYEWGVFSVGQVAHITGATDGPGSPRGESPLTAAERAAPSNLMLLCYPCHRRVDGDDEHWPREYLLERKNEFEARVRAATDFSSLEQTVVIRMTAPIRGNRPPITNAQVSEGLQARQLTFAGEDPRDATERIELQAAEDDPGSWTTASAQIHRGVDRAVRSLAETSAESVSVFAFAPIPLLVDLGAAIGTKQTTHVFEPGRRGDRTTFRWAEDSPPAVFTTSASTVAAATDALDVVVLVSLTAAVQMERAPASLLDLPRFRLDVEGGTRASVIRSDGDLLSFAAAWRDLLQMIESRCPRVARIHLITAAPIAAAIELGRQRMRDAHPALVVYQLTAAQQYEPVLTIS
jgi:hypothetical protein